MTKEQLQQYLKDNREIERLGRRIQTLKHELYGIRAVPLSDMPKGTAQRDSVEELIDTKQELINEYILRQQDHNANMLKIEAAILNMKNQRYKDLLSMRYLDGRTWEYIAEDMGIEIRWVYRLHGKALKEIDH